eukprot:scaffold3020_cov342-Prasinococcus_capsulatus_cf.AAC.13
MSPSTRKTGAGRPEGPAWELFPMINGKPTCVKCGKQFNSFNIAKLKPHLNVCPKRDELTASERRTFMKGGVTELVRVITPGDSEAAGAEHATRARPRTLDTYVDRCSPADVEEFLLRLGKWVVGCAIPMNTLSSEWFKELITFLRPAIARAMPKSLRKIIAGRVLQRLHTDLQEQMQTHVEEGQYLTLISDGWTNCAQAGVISCCLYFGMAGSAMFYSSTNLDGERETSEYYFNVVNNVIKEVGPSRFIAVVFDNCSTMNLVGELVEENYKHIYFVGCSAHLLNLLVKDIFAIEFFKTTLDECVDIVKYIKNRQVLSAIYKRLKRELKVPGIGLCLPVETRWASSIRCIHSVDENFKVLEEVLRNAQYLAFKGAQTSAVQKEKLKAFESRVNDPDFRAKLMKVLRMTNKLADLIYFIEQDKVPQLSQVIPAIEPLWDAVESTAPTLFAGIDDGVGTAVKERIDERFMQIARPIAWLAAGLDPRNHDQLCSQGLIRNKIMSIFDRESEAGSDHGQLVREWRKWELKTGFHPWAFAEGSLEGNDFMPAAWWAAEGHHLPALQALAQRVLTIPATSAAAERSFSSYGCVMSKNRYRLQANTVQKLVYCYLNLRLQASGSLGASARDYSLEDDVEALYSEELG